ncbi:MAG: hypothetical protein HYU37_18500 [Acidobacteria bacterium]|nr:hypothetical protein [Acidobacteriota bacterium]
MEISQVRKRLTQAITAARERARRRREQTAEAETAYTAFLQQVATPVTKQLANALKAEGYLFTVFTPGDGLRLASDRGRDDYVEFALDTAAEPPQVIGRISLTRGSRTLTDERPIRPGAAPSAIAEEDVLSFLLDALGPWLDR